MAERLLIKSPFVGDSASLQPAINQPCQVVENPIDACMIIQKAFIPLHAKVRIISFIRSSTHISVFPVVKTFSSL